MAAGKWKGGTDTGWIAPTLTNSWTNQAAGAPAGYRRQGTAVYLRGLVGGGASGNSAFTLPVGFRPAYDTYLVGARTLTSSISSHQVLVGADGTVTPRYGSGNAGFDGLMFFID